MKLLKIEIAFCPGDEIRAGSPVGWLVQKPELEIDPDKKSSGPYNRRDSGRHSDGIPAEAENP